jgi:hypothetical protein
MASLAIATKANLAVVLPSLLMAGYLEHTAVLSTTRTFQDQATLSNDAFVQLSLHGGEYLKDEAIIEYFAKIANSNASPEDASSISICSRGIKKLPSNIITRLKNGSSEARTISSKISSPSVGQWTT